VSSHDDACGSQRGVNTIFCFVVDGVRLCHLGDIGHQPSDQLLSQIGEVDVLLIPTGGVYTIDPRGANQVCEKIKPSIVIPMHYMTAKRTGPPLEKVDEFVKLRTNVRMMDTSDVEFEKQRLPAVTETMVLKHAL
jgi:Predicted Zn-dependent hydrolases of the beta-lactamase fold